MLFYRRHTSFAAGIAAFQGPGAIAVILTSWFDHLGGNSHRALLHGFGRTLSGLHLHSWGTCTSAPGAAAPFRALALLVIVALAGQGSGIHAYGGVEVRTGARLTLQRLEAAIYTTGVTALFLPVTVLVGLTF